MSITASKADLSANQASSAPAFFSLWDVHAYYGESYIVQGISMNIHEGEILALLGRNGAGKTSTLRAIARTDDPAVTQGEIWLDHKPLHEMKSYQAAAEGVALVPEDRRIFSDLSVQENLEVGRQPVRPDTPEWTIEKLFELFPNLAERRANLGSQMSGGEQQMLTIARTLMGQPRLILLDEPSEGLAPVIVEQMALTISALKQQGLAVLISEQNLHFARIVADRVYIIEKGVVRYQGTMAELAAAASVRETYLAV